MSQRPKTSGRPPTGLSNRPITGRSTFGGDGRPPSTPRAMQPTGTARPGSRANLGTAQGRGITAQITVVDRPMTQHGLGGLKTAVQRNQRQVQDKSYFQGILRTKISELNAEISKLAKEIDQLTKEQSTYLTYDKRAKAFAQALSDLQGELGDYNMLVDKLNTDTEIDEVQRDYKELQAQNEKESQAVDFIFANRREKELQMQQLERQIEQEKNAAETMVSSMSPDLRDKYVNLMQNNKMLQVQMEKLQQELDTINSKKAALEDEVSVSQVKQEAVGLYEKIRELTERHETLMEEEKSRGTPAQEQERLLKQVKEDNQEIARMDRQTAELTERITKIRDEIEQVEQDLEENQSERSQKYRELKKRDEIMTQFLDTYDAEKVSEQERKVQLEQTIVELLEQMSQKLSHFQHIPSQQEMVSLREDLNVKEVELVKSKVTATSLIQEQHKVNADLQKIEQLEEKIKDEMVVLEKKMKSMSEEMVVYSNTEQLKSSAEERQHRLKEQQKQLAKQREYIKNALAEVQSEYDSIKIQLNENETHAQLTNLERKWQHVEQTNFAMKEFVATKLAETNYKPISKTVVKQIAEFNQLLQDQLIDGLLKR